MCRGWALFRKNVLLVAMLFGIGVAFANADLPEGYTRVDYIESTGGQYIKAEYIHTSNTKIVCVANVAETQPSVWSTIFGSRNGAYTKNALEFFATSSKPGTVYSRTGNEATGGNLPFGELIEITAEGTTASWRGLERTSLTGSITTTGTPDDGIHSLFIFAMNQSTSARGTVVQADSYSIMKLYSFKIYESNELKRDFVPCISPTGEPGLFDLVDGRFHNNRGEGRFYVPGEPEMRFGGKIWSQTFGKQWFNTEYVPNQATRIEAFMRPAAYTESWAELFGVWNNDSSQNAVAVRYYEKTAKLNGLFCNNDYKEAQISVTANTDMHILLEMGKFAVNATTVTVTSVNNPYQSNLYLFGGNNSGAIRRNQTVRMYDFKISENGVLKRDYIPMRAPNNVVSLYDKATGTICPNMGACALPCGGSFTYMEENGDLTLFEGRITAADIAGYAHITKAGPLALKASDVAAFPALNVQQGVVSFWDGLAKNYTVQGALALAGGTRLQLDVMADGADMITAGSIDLSTASAANPITLAFHDIGTVAFDGTRTILAGGVTTDDLAKFKVVSAVPFTLGVENGALTIAYAGVTLPLPAGYTQLEYIRSTGTQYINTGYLHTPFTTLSCEILVPEQTVASLAAFGAQDSTGVGGWRSLLFMPRYNGQLRFDSADDPIVGTTSQIFAPLDSFPFGERVTVAYTDGCLSWHGGSLPDGQLRSTVASIGVDNDMLYIFDVDTVRVASNFRGEMRLYSFRIFEGDVLVRDFVPCISPRGEVGLYDRVGQVFYGNAGSGRFLAPTDSLPTTAPYVESTGVEYVDTGYQATTDTKVEIYFNPKPPTTAWGEFFGALQNDSSANAFTLRYYNTSLIFNGLCCNATYGEAQVTIVPENDYYVSLEYGRLSVSGLDKVITSVNEPYAGNLLVFAGSNGGTVRRNQAMRLYRLKISERGTLVHDFVPWRTEDGQVGLYDQLDGNAATAFHPNKGKGALIYGTTTSAFAGCSQTEMGQKIDEQHGTTYVVREGAFSQTDVPADCTVVEKAGPLGVSMAGVTAYPALTIADGAFLVDDGAAQTFTVTGTLALGAGVRLALDVTAAGNDTFTVGSLDLGQATAENPVLLFVNAVGVAELEEPRTLIAGASLTSADLAKFVLSANLPAVLAIQSGNLVLIAKETVVANWVGGGTTGAWSDAANWQDGVVPEIGAAVTFNTVANLATAMDLAGLVVKSIAFGDEAGAFTVSGSMLTIQKKITNTSAQPQVFNEPMSLGVTGSRFTVDTGAQAMSLVGGVGATASVIEKKGTGELTIDDTAIAQAGGLDIQQGTVKLNVTELQTTAATPGEIHVAAGARLDVNVDHGSLNSLAKTEAVHGKTLYLAGDGPDGKGALYNSNPISHWGTTVGHLVLTDDASFGGGHLSVRPLEGSANSDTQAQVEGGHTLALRIPVMDETATFYNTFFALDRLELRNSKMQLQGALTGVITNGIHLYGASAINFYGPTMTAEMPIFVEDGEATMVAGGNTGLAAPVTVKSEATVTFANGSAITFNAPFVNEGTVVRTGAGNICFAGDLTGTGTFESRAGSLIFTHDVPSYAGQFNMTGGSLQFGNAGTTTAPTAIPPFGTVSTDVKFLLGATSTIGAQYDDVIAKSAEAKKIVTVLSTTEQNDFVLSGANWDVYTLRIGDPTYFGRFVIDEGATVNVWCNLELASTGKSPKNSTLEVKTGGTLNFTNSSDTCYIGYWSGVSTSTHHLIVSGGTVNVPNANLVTAEDSAYGYVDLNDGKIAAKGVKVRGRTNDAKAYAHDERFIQRGGVLELGGNGFSAGEVKFGTPYLNLAGGTLKPMAALTLPYGTYWSCFGEKPSDAGDYTIDLNGQTVNWQTGLEGFSDVTITGTGSFVTTKCFQNVPQGNWKVEGAAGADLSGAAGFGGGLSLGEDAQATIDIGGEGLVEMGMFTTAEFANFTAVTNYAGAYQYRVNTMERLHKYEATGSKVQYCFYCFRGQFYVPEKKTYYFAGTYDDYLTFEIDGQVMLSNVGEIGKSWQNVPTTNRELNPGWHNFRVCAYDQTGGQGPGYSDWNGVMALGWTTKQPAVLNSSAYYTKFDPSTLRMRPGVCTWQKQAVYNVALLDSPDFVSTTNTTGCLGSLQMLREYNGKELRAFCPNKTTCRFTGEFFAPTTGDYEFTGHFDDIVSIIIDGQLVCKTTSWSDTIIGTGTISLREGWHRFDVRVADNTGNVGTVNAVTVKVPGTDTAVPFDEGSFEMRAGSAGLGGVSLLAKGSTLFNISAGVCPIWGTLGGAGALDGNFAFETGATWRVGIDGSKLTDVVNVTNVGGSNFVKNLRHIEVELASRAETERYRLCAAGSLTAAEAAEIEVTAYAKPGVTDAVTEGWRAVVSGNVLMLVNPKPAGLILFIK